MPRKTGPEKYKIFIISEFCLSSPSSALTLRHLIILLFLYLILIHVRKKKRGRKSGAPKTNTRSPDSVPQNEWKEIFDELDLSRALRTVSGRHRLSASSIWRAYKKYKTPDENLKVRIRSFRED
jgi:hypothetical protein